MQFILSEEHKQINYTKAVQQVSVSLWRRVHISLRVTPAAAGSGDSSRPADHKHEAAVLLKAGTRDLGPYVPGPWLTCANSPRQLFQR